MIPKWFGLPPSFSKTWQMGSGFDLKKWRDGMLKKYKDACIAAVKDPDLKASDLDGDGDLETKCNWGVKQICEEMGYKAFDGKTANQIYSLLEVDPEWHLAGPGVCNKKLEEGAIAIAALEDNPSGHVAMIYPGSLGSSGKWQTEKGPMVATT